MNFLVLFLKTFKIKVNSPHIEDNVDDGLVLDVEFWKHRVVREIFTFMDKALLHIFREARYVGDLRLQSFSGVGWLDIDVVTLTAKQLRIDLHFGFGDIYKFFIVVNVNL